MTNAPLSLPQVRPLGKTLRKDAWWVTPLVTALLLLGFIVYSTWAALQGQHYWYAGEAGANYISPMYSPELFGSSPHALFGPQPSWLPWPAFLTYSPAFLILWAPGGFRFTCYYYRGSYYKALWADPISCTVGEPGFRGKNYRGEAKWPLLIQNAHRYFLYLALLFLIFLGYDAFISYMFTTDTGARFGVHVGSLVLTMNFILLGCYTFSCHSLRHIVGGAMDKFSGRPIRKAAHDCVTCLNKKHMHFAWASLIWVGFSDLYVRMCSMEIWTDFRII